MTPNTPSNNEKTPLSVDLIKSQAKFSHLSDDEVAQILDNIITFSEILFVIIQNNPTFDIDNDTLTVNDLEEKTNKNTKFKDAA